MVIFDKSPSSITRALERAYLKMAHHSGKGQRCNAYCMGIPSGVDWTLWRHMCVYVDTPTMLRRRKNGMKQRYKKRKK